MAEATVESAAKGAAKGKKKVASKKAATGAVKAEAGAMDVINDKDVFQIASKGQGKADSFVTTVATGSVVIEKNFNPREVPGDIDELASNIKRNGLLQFPVVRPTGKPGQYSVVAGERRVRALMKLGRKTITVTVRPDLEGNYEKARAVSVAENSEDGRFNLNAIEIGRVCIELAQKGWTVSSIASETGLHPRKVRRCQSLMEAPKDVLKKVQTGELSVSAGLELAKLDDSTRSKIKDSLSVNAGRDEIKKAAKAVAKAAGGTEGLGKQHHQKKGLARDASLTAWKGSKVKQAKLAELCYHLKNAAESEVGTVDYHELRGAVGFALWDRGDLDDPILPSLEPDDPDEKKLLLLLNKHIDAEAAKFTPGDDGEDEDDEE